MARAGAQALSLLSAPLHASLLTALEEGPKQPGDLRQETGFPPPTTIRTHLRALEDTEIVSRLVEEGFGGSTSFELTLRGRGLLLVLTALAEWLTRAPKGPLEIGSAAAQRAIKALAEGWATNIVRVLAVQSLSLTELNDLIAGVSYHSLERRLGAMRVAGQVEKRAVPGRGVPYTANLWLKEAFFPILAAAHWERSQFQAEAVPMGARDVEAAILLAAPILRLPSECSGSCRLTVELSQPGRSSRAGALLRVNQGRLIQCTTRLEGRPDSWIAGSDDAWLQAVVLGDMSELELGGKPNLAAALLEGMRNAPSDAKNATGDRSALMR